MWDISEHRSELRPTFFKKGVLKSNCCIDATVLQTRHRLAERLTITACLTHRRPYFKLCWIIVLKSIFKHCVIEHKITLN